MQPWTASELRAGGLPAHTDLFEALTSGEVVGQARREEAAIRASVAR